MVDDTSTKKNDFLSAYDAYADAIYRHCYFRVFRKARAEELMQDTFMKAWEYMQKGNNVENLRAFLYKIANNLIIDESRKKKEESLDVLLEGNMLREPSYRAETALESSILLAEVKEKLKHLSEDEQRLITLRYFDDLDPKDIAEVLGDNANNVSVKLNRALKKLKQYI